MGLVRDGQSGSVGPLHRIDELDGKMKLGREACSQSAMRSQVTRGCGNASAK